MLSTQERRLFDSKFSALWGIDPVAVMQESERHAQSIDKVGIGGVIRISGEVFVVAKSATYTETNDKYTKDKDYVATEFVLFSLKTGETRYIEWAIDDELEISFTERKLTVSEMRNRLHDDEGQPFDIDEDIDECVEEGWPIMFDRVTYPYDDDWACRYESSDGRKFNAYIYEFGSEERGWLTIEGWQDGKDWEYEGYLSHDIAQNAIEIISTGS